jgi:HlyD family secretion protein
MIRWPHLRLRTTVATLGVILGMLVLIGWLIRPQPIEVRTKDVERMRFEQTIDEEGLTRVRDRFVVSAPIAGQVSRARLEVGDPVAAGQLLAEIIAQPPPMIDWRTLGSLTERAAVAQAAVAGSMASRDRAAAALNLARAELARNRELFGNGFISEAALQTSTLGVEERRQAVRAADMAVEAAAHELAAARAALVQVNPKGPPSAGPGAALPIQAPEAGRILRVIQENESFVPAGAPLYELADPSKLEVIVDVLSQDAASIHAGQQARLAFDLGAPRHPAEVVRLEPVARTKISALGVEEQRVRVILELKSEAVAPLGEAWRVNASIITLAENDALVIPSGALIRQGETWSAFVLSNGRAHQISLDLAARNARHAWVKSGLTPGQTVVLYPPASLRSGARAQVRAPD